MELKTELGELLKMIEREELNPELTGTIKKQILTFLKSGNGFYYEEISKKISCNEKVLYRNLGILIKAGWIESKTFPEKNTGNKKVYYLTEKGLEAIRKN